MRKRYLYLVAVLGLLVVIGVAAYLFSDGAGPKTSYRFAKLERGPLTATVSATGTLNPVVSVQVGSQVSGQVKEIYVDYNSEVKKDQVIARIDPESFKLRVNQAQADLESARATVLTQLANVTALQSEVSRARVTLADAERDFKRNEQLVEKKFVSEAVRDKAQAAFEAAREQLKTAEAQLEVGRAQVRNVQALVKQREAQLSQAMVDLDRTSIRAPVDGIVISRSVDAGQTVAASLQAPTLFLIAKNLTDMQVETSIDESEVGRVQLGQEASFTVDSFPGRTFSGKVTQLRKAPQVVQNVVTYIAVISAANPDLALVPGMTANVRLVVDRRDNALKVPNAALRFRPPGAGGAAKDAAKTGGAPAKGGQGGQALRERLTKELNLNAEQQAKLEEIMRASRQKIQGIAADNPEERRKQVARLRAESRVEIAAMLNEEQKARYEEIVSEGRRATRGQVWILDENGRPKSVNVRLGLSDGTHTELVGGALKEGAEIIVASGAAAGKSPAKKGGGSPRMAF